MPQAEGNVVETPNVTPVETPVVDQNKPVVADAHKPVPVAGKNDGVVSAREQGLIADNQRERKARQALEQKVNELNTNYERERKRMKLLVSDDPQSDEEQEIATIRAQFAKVYPGLAKLTDAQIEKILASTESAGSAEEVINQHWSQHARTTIDSLVEAVEDAAGTDLTDRQKRRVTQLFTSALEADPALEARYKKGDKKLIEEFVAEYVEDFVTPAKRQVTNAEVGRFKPVPRGGDRNVRNTPPAKKIDFTNEKAVEDAMVESFKSHGGTFKR